MANTKIIRFKNNDLLVYFATTFKSRLVGLIGSDIPDNYFFVLPRCRAIHMFFMTRQLDVVFLDAAHKIIKICRYVRPFYFASCQGAADVIEMNAGVSRSLNLSVGDSLSEIFDE